MSRSKFSITISFIILCSFLIQFTLLAQDIPKYTKENPPPPDWNIQYGIELPIGKTQWEIENEHLFPKYIPTTDDPPPQPVVNPAEWERMTGVLIRYPLGISYSIIAEMSEDVVVTTIVSTTSQMNTVYNLYQSNGVNMDNVDWLIAASNSIWTRDYGPWFLFTGDDVQGISNHTYNRPSRPYDNLIPLRFGEANNIPVYDLPLIHTGGNWMTDGMGVSMSTDLVYDENSLTQQQVDNYIMEYTGNDYFVMEDILTYGIHHIDCWAKMLDPGRILVKRLDPPNAQLEENVALLENTMSSYGRPYEVIRVDCASSTPYTNGIILNNKAFVPIFGNALDGQAVQTWANALPGYEIIPVTGSWVSDDAIHCRSKGIVDRYMLRIVHQALNDQEGGGDNFEVLARIHPYSNEPLSTGFPKIWWSVDGGAFSSVQMTNTVSDTFVGYIPQQPDSSTIQYYIHAQDESGRVEYHPFIGEPNAHTFRVIGDNTPPEIVHNPLPDLSTYEWPPTISAIVTDNMEVSEVYVEYYLNSVAQPDIPLELVGGNLYEGELAGTVQIGDLLEYRIVAIDGSAAQNTSYAPEFGYYQCEIAPATFCDMEDGAPGWTHSAITPTFGDQWHLTTLMNHTPGGTQCWKCGSEGTGTYDNLLDAGLVSDEYTIGNASHLSFWHWMSAETSSSYPGYAYDGGLVEISVNSGEWAQITPEGGYPYLVRLGSNPGPFPAETPIFSGDTGGWEYVMFDLSGTSGNVRFRFRFGSDGEEGFSGWNIDDVLIVDAGGAGSPIEVTLTPTNPPINIPSGGGSFEYTLNIDNVGTTSYTFDAWIEAVLPGGSVYGPILLRNLTLNQSASLLRDMSQVVPGGAPSGDYLFRLNVGNYPDDIWDSDSFSFEKQ